MNSMKTNNYCSSCGYKISGTGVNFCPKCGQNLKSVGRSRADIEEEEYIETNIDYSSLRDKIKISVDIPKNAVVTVGDVIEAAKKTGPTSEAMVSRPPAKLPKGKKAILSAVRDECKASKGNSKEVL